MVVIEHVMFLFKAISSGLIDKVPRVVREAQAIIAIQQKKERREFRRMASGLPVRENGRQRCSYLSRPFASFEVISLCKRRLVSLEPLGANSFLVSCACILYS